MQGKDAAEDVVIVGAGMAGLAAALGLHRKGVRSLVLESSPSLRTSGFAFTTWKNAFRALDALGVGDKIREQHMQAQRYVVTRPIYLYICISNFYFRRACLAAGFFVSDVPASLIACSDACNAESSAPLLNVLQVARHLFRHRRDRARSRPHAAGETRTP